MKYIVSKFVKALKFDGGGGKSLCQKHLKTLKFIQLPFENLKQYFLFRQIISSKGAILIEFAFCLPVLIVLIYYIYDLNRLKRYYSRTEFVAQQIASMIQNISQSRESKAITRKDLQRIIRMAYLSIYPGMSMYKQNGYFEFGHQPSIYILCVKGLDNGNASCVWAYQYYLSYGISDFGIIRTYDSGYYRPVYFKTDVAPSQIYPSLTISPGEVKIIVISRICRSLSTFQSLNGKYLTDKQAFNFYLISPKYKNPGGQDRLYFPSIIVFTPRPGLFSETPPV